MKVYRILPNCFLTNKGINSSNINGYYEYLCYDLGYVSFRSDKYNIKRQVGMCNTLEENIKDEGKYFFLFPEDAIMQGDSLLWGMHRINCHTCMMVEYDIPTDILLKNIGYGDYSKDIMKDYLIESHVERSDFGSSDFVTSEVISKEEKLDILTSIFNKSLQISKELVSGSFHDYFYYLEYFEEKGFNIEDVINNINIIKNSIESSELYLSFLKETRQLVSTPYITGKAVPVNREYLSSLKSFEKIAEHFNNQGINVDYSKQQKEFKEEVLNNLKDKQKVKTLLNNRGPIK